MARIYPVFVKRTTVIEGGGGGDVPIPFPDSVEMSDPVFVAGDIGTDPVNLSEIAVNALTTEPDTVDGSDAFMASGTAAAVDTVDSSDAVPVTVAWTAPAASGTPDSDAWSDAWTDSASSSTNHGSGGALNVNGAVTGQRIVWLALDFTRFSGFTPTSALTLNFHVGTNANLGAVTLTVAIGTSNTRPFTESTINASNQPGTPSLESNTINIGTGSGDKSLAIVSQAHMTSLLGKWLLVKITGQSTQTSDVGIASRDSATPPSASFTLTT